MGSWRMRVALRRRAAIACLVWAIAFSVLATAYALPSGPNARLAVSDASPYVGQAVTFDASGSVAHDSGNGAIVAYRFDFGDGTDTGWQPSPTATHAYTSAGNVTARVTVEDGRGLEDAAFVDLDVRLLVPTVPTPDLVPIRIGFGPETPKVGDTVTVTVLLLNAGNETAVAATVRFLDQEPGGNLTWIGNVSLAAPVAPSEMATVASPPFMVEVAGNHTIRIVVANVRPAQAYGDRESRATLVVGAGGTSSSGGPPLVMSPLVVGLAGAGAVALVAGIMLLLRPRPPGPMEPPPATPEDKSPPPLWPP